VPVGFKLHDKKYASYKRKKIERPSKGGIKDAFGIEIAFGVRSHEEAKHVPEYVSRCMAEELLTDMFIGLISQGHKIELSNIRQKGVFNNLLDSLQVIQDHQGQEITLIKPQSGSGASGSKWSWIKFVLKVGNHTCEVQIFASEEDHKKKKLDDPDFARGRFIISHEVGKRVPPVDVWYRGEEESYVPAMKYMHAARRAAYG
jgi:hypothetical protein